MCGWGGGMLAILDFGFWIFGFWILPGEVGGYSSVGEGGRGLGVWKEGVREG